VSRSNASFLSAVSVPAGSMLVAECSFNFSAQMEEPELEDATDHIGFVCRFCCCRIHAGGRVLLQLQ
jgi:hypothetical protein